MCTDENNEIQRPFICNNIIAFNKAQGDPYQGYEVPLFTDAKIIGDIDNPKFPYQIFNCRSFPYQTIEQPSIVLRIWRFITANEEMLPMIGKESNIKTFHGGSETDEIAALISLELGIRIQAGNETRRFDGEDQFGSPVTSNYKSNPILLKHHNQKTILPNLPDEVNLNNIKMLYKISDMENESAIQIIRCARCYQEGIWIADFDPQQAWILLISAIENAANCWRNIEYTPRERLKTFDEDLEKMLFEKGGEEFTDNVAQKLIRLMGPTKKFIDFLTEFCPPEPLDRPTNNRIDWKESILKKSFSCIYNWRSRFLHDGIPIPIPLCRCPEQYQNSYSERPSGIQIQTCGGVWQRDDLPMHLHVFQYIARNALLNWIGSEIKKMKI